MAATDNVVFETAIGFASKIIGAPEGALYGYAKLLMMEESSIIAILGEEALKDVEGARRVMEKSGLDMKLIKSGFVLASTAAWTAKEEAKVIEYNKFIEKAGSATSSSEILSVALDAIRKDLLEVFMTGHSMQNVFDYVEEHKNDPSDFDDDEKDKKEESSSGKEDKHSQEKSSEEKTSEKKTSEKKASEDKGDSKEESKAASDDEKKTLGDLSTEFRKLNTSLLEVIKGQDEAVFKFVRGVFQGQIFKNTEKHKGPRAYFFFFGPPGVGKTLLAETAAENMGIPSKIFNMSEYAGPQAEEQLVGFAKTYSNSTEGRLTKYVKENPESILVFDEIEKAGSTVIRLFLQILSSGILNDKYTNKDVDFSKTLIIFTSNAGRELYEDRSKKLSSIPDKVMINAISRETNSMGAPVLPPEICSRIAAGNTIIFNHLPVSILAKMTNDNFEKATTMMLEEYQVNITYDSRLPLLFIYNRGGGLDARVTTGQSTKFIKNEVFELLRQLQNVSSKQNNLKNIEFKIDWTNAGDELNSLFFNSGKAEVLLFGSSELAEAFDTDSDNFVVYSAKTLEEAREYMKKDISAIFIDPIFESGVDKDSILSVADYATPGNELFKEIVRANSGMPVFIIEQDQGMSEIDENTYIQEGADGIFAANLEHPESLKRQFKQIMDELYMENMSQQFSQRGFIISFNSRQEVSEDGTKADIVFYDLKKSQALDVDDQGQVLMDVERPKTRFSDVIGAEDAKEELRYFIQFLKNPKQFLLTGGKPPKGVLLYGPPGTGKTMLARAMAGESDVTFIQTSASEFKDKWVGGSEENIRKVFRRAKKYAPAVIFIDEIDAVGKQRTGSDSGTESMLNALLTEMDGFSSDPKKPIFVLAATNYGVEDSGDGIAKLDEALMRRFDNKIKVDLPNKKERLKYIEIMLAKKGMTQIKHETMENLAERTSMQSLAILQNVMDLAFRNAAKEMRTADDNDLMKALEDYNYGEKKERSADYYKSVAYHEVGHAFLYYLMDQCPSYITIEARGSFYGYMQHADQEDTDNHSKEYYLGMIRTSLAGRAAETIFRENPEDAINDGASSDLEHATHYATNMICRLGMYDGLMVVDPKVIMSGPLAATFMEKVNKLLAEQMEKVTQILSENKEVIERVVQALLERNYLTGDDFKKLIEGNSND